MKRVGILGATGSIGSQTLAVLEAFPDRYRVAALSAHRNMALLARQIQQFSPEAVAVGSEQKARELETLLAEQCVLERPEILIGEPGLLHLVSLPDVDVLVIGLVGFAGLMPTLKALEAGKRVLTANKETFVVAGHLVQPYLSRIVPLDSEHSAVFQCLQGCRDPQREVRTLYLTASGGPFRETPPDQLTHVTPEAALRHPNWTMGEKVTIDSATMMNKGFEIIEAHHLFGLPIERIEVVVHPQSIVHSAVAFTDGSVLAQMGQPDMRVPIQYGLSYPARWPEVSESVHLDLTRMGTLTFQPADENRFPALRLARWAGETGGTLPVVLNACDELAVEAFLHGQLGFTQIPESIEAVMRQHMPDWEGMPSLSRIIETDAWARDMFRIRLPEIARRTPVSSAGAPFTES